MLSQHHGPWWEQSIPQIDCKHLDSYFTTDPSLNMDWDNAFLTPCSHYAGNYLGHLHMISLATEAAQNAAAAGDAPPPDESYTLFLEDDTRLRPSFAAAFDQTLKLQPPGTWDVLLAHGGGTPPGLRPFRNESVLRGKQRLATDLKAKHNVWEHWAPPIVRHHHRCLRKSPASRPLGLIASLFGRVSMLELEPAPPKLQQHQY